MALAPIFEQCELIVCPHDHSRCVCHGGIIACPKNRKVLLCFAVITFEDRGERKTVAVFASVWFRCKKCACFVELPLTEQHLNPERLEREIGDTTERE